MNDYTTNYPTCGTTESNDSIEIKKPFLSEKTSKTLKVITFFIGIIITFIVGVKASNYMMQNTFNKVYKDAFVQGYEQGYRNAKIEALKQDKTIDISKAFQYDGNKK